MTGLHTVCGNTHRLAVLTDQCLGLGRNDHTRLETAVNLLQESFSKTLNDRKPLEVSKVCIDIGTGLVRIHFVGSQTPHKLSIVLSFGYIYI